MDDILQQAIGQAGIADTPNSTNQRALQPRPAPANQIRQVGAGTPTGQVITVQQPGQLITRNGQPTGQRLRVVTSQGQQRVYRTANAVTSNGNTVVVRQSPARPPPQGKNIIVVQNPGNYHLPPDIFTTSFQTHLLVRQVQAGQTIVVQQGSNGSIQENGIQRTVQTISGTPVRTVRAPPTRPGGPPTRVLVQKTPQPAPRPNQPRRQLYPINQPSYECLTCFRLGGLYSSFKCSVYLANFVFQA